MKTKMIVLVGMLFTQIVFTSNNVYGEDVMAIMKDRHKVHLITHKGGKSAEKYSTCCLWLY